MPMCLMTNGDLLAEVSRLPYKLRFVWDYDHDVSEEEMKEFPDTEWLCVTLEKSCEQCGSWELADHLGAVCAVKGDAFDVGPVTIESALAGVKYPDDSQYYQRDVCRDMLQMYLAEVKTDGDI